MEKYTQQIKDWYSKFQNRSVSYEKKGIRPLRDWKIMFVSSFFIICLLAVYSFYLYTKIDSGEMFAVQKDAGSRETEINKNLLNKVVTDVNTRESFIERLKNTGAPGDPSI